MTTLGFAEDLDDAEQRQYAHLGFAFRHIAELDYQLEAFMFYVSKCAPRFCSSFSNTFPGTFQEKIDFVILCYQQFPQLRSFGDSEGKSDPNLMGYGLEEVFAFRNAFFHSSTDLVEHLADGFIWEATRHRRSATNKRSFHRMQFSFGSGYLDRIVDLSRYFVGWFVDAERSLAGDDVAERLNRARKINSGHYWDLQFRVWEAGELR